MSGVGKGVASASIGKILQSRGLTISSIKIDPYLNVDAGTMNPIEHGEVFVLESGLECDQDMGNYERFLDIEVPAENYMTNGMIFKTVIDRERNLGYNGACVEPTYHISEEIINRIRASAKKTQADITIVEIGGTVGEYQNAIFIEAARTMKLKNPADVIFALVSYLPIPGTLGEMKTKPTQNAVRTLNSYGVHPDIIIGRGAYSLDDKRKSKIGDMCSVPYNHIISAPDVSNIYEVPLLFEKDNFSTTLLKLLKIKVKTISDLTTWRAMVERCREAREDVHIGIVGKYFRTGDYVLSDVYISIIESLKHAAFVFNRRLSMDWLDSVEYEKDKSKLDTLFQYDGILIPGGFGTRGVEGKIQAIQYVREHKIPYFGICYGMQLALVEYARNVIGHSDAHTTEVSKKTTYPVIDVMPEQIRNIKLGHYGGTMRLGAYEALITKDTHAYNAYSSMRNGRWYTKREDSKTISVKERHRHRYEVNPRCVSELETAGVVFSGKTRDGMLMEIMELPLAVHPFFIGMQAHPEFTGSPLHPHPMFTAFLRASINK